MSKREWRTKRIDELVKKLGCTRRSAKKIQFEEESR